MALLDKLIWQIEARMTDVLSLEVLAQRSAVSRYHMCRMFQQATGLSIMAYVRARRLSIAAQRIAQTEDDLLTIALDAGYGSHEAFTRAFTALFGVLPSTLRKTRKIAHLTLMEPFEMQKDMIVHVDSPDIRSLAAFRVIGFSLDCTLDNLSGIPQLWQSFNTREHELDGAASGTAYGVHLDMTEDGRFTYVAGMTSSAVPDGMQAFDIPANTYAMFTHRGHISDLSKTLYTIWNKMLPDAELEPKEGPDFELYDRRFNPTTGFGEVELWIPITQ